ncbi:MAG: hypothetical protein AB2A00_24740, partial [Myxococcota bacterium]
MSLFVMAVLTVLLAQLWWLWPALTGASAFFTRDILAFRLPYQARLGAELVEGRWPAWAPEFGGGMPLWHHPSAENADPLTLLFALLPPHHANAVSMALHLVLTTVGMALLCRSLRVHPVLSAWAGLMYACSGPAASFYTVGFMDVTSLPWVLLGGRMCARPSSRARWLVPLVVAYRLLRPDPLMVAASMVLAALVAWSCAALGRRRQALVELALGSCLGALLAAPFLLPAAA